MTCRPNFGGPKAITIAFPIDPTALGGSASGLGAAVVPSRYFKEFPNAYLTTYNQQDETVPWLAVVRKHPPSKPAQNV